MVGLAALRLGLDARLLLANPLRYYDAEESYNATVAWLLGSSNAGAGELLALQYKAFCGGCTVVSTLGAAPLALAGDSLLAWKSLALLWTLATVLLTWAAVRQLAGPSAAIGALALVALAPPGLSEQSLMLWGNHAQVMLGVWAAVALAARQRLVLAGLVAGASVAFARAGFIGVPAVVALALVSERRAAWVLPGMALGALLVLLPAAGGDAGDYSLWATRDDHLSHLLRLLAPRELGRRLYLNAGPGVWLLLPAAAALLTLRGRARAMLVMLATAAAGWALADVDLRGDGSQVLPLNNRYLAPWFALLLPAIGAALAQPGRLRAARVALLLALLAVAGDAQRRHPGGGGPGHEARVVDLAWFSGVAVNRLDWSALRSSHPRTEAALRRLEGFQTGDPSSATGFGAGERPGARSGNTRESARGQAHRRSFDEQRSPTAILGAIEHPSQLSLVGIVHGRQCLSAPDPIECAAQVPGQAADLPEIAFGLGLALRQPWLPVGRIRELGQELRQRGGADVVEQLFSGWNHPAAGAHRPLQRQSG